MERLVYSLRVQFAAFGFFLSRSPYLIVFTAVLSVTKEHRLVASSGAQSSGRL